MFEDDIAIDSTNHDFLLLRAQSAANSLHQHKRSVIEARKHLIGALELARSAGIPVTQIAKVTGLSRQTIHTLLGA